MDQKRLAQEYAALNPVYAPQKTLIQQQVSALPAQYAAEKSALEQAKANAFRDISSEAQSRGTFFSGFRPEQMARYTGEKYLPALAGISSQQQQARFNLEKALADLNMAQRQAATTNLQNVLNREQQQRQFEQSLAASRASGGGGGGGGYTFDYGGVNPSVTSMGSTPQLTLPQQRKDKGFNFQDMYGTPVNAAEYVTLYNSAGGRLKFTDLLRRMAKQGDTGAAAILPWVGNDMRLNPNAPQNLAGLFRAFGVKGKIKPKPQPTAKVQPGFQGSAFPRFF